MKNLLSIGLLLFLSLVSFSQKKTKEIFQFRDSAGETVRQEKDARFFARIRRMNDTCWQFQNYEMMGPLATSGEYKDNESILAHGRSSFMRTDGTLDSTGYFVNGKPNGTWFYFTNGGNLSMKKEYSMGELLWIWNTDKTGDKKDTANNEPDVEAQFPGLNSAWNMYLLRNFRYPPYAFANRIQGTVTVFFMIDTEGRVQEELLLKSAEFTLDDEALRLVRESVKWIPATKDGRKVKSYKQLPVTFKME